MNSAKDATTNDAPDDEIGWIDLPLLPSGDLLVLIFFFFFSLHVLHRPCFAKMPLQLLVQALQIYLIHPHKPIIPLIHRKYPVQNAHFYLCIFSLLFFSLFSGVPLLMFNWKLTSTSTPLSLWPPLSVTHFIFHLEVSYMLFNEMPQWISNQPHRNSLTRA